MDEKLITLFCICDDALNACGVVDDPQAKMSQAEVLCTALAAAYLFAGSYRRSRWFLSRHGYMPQMLSQSRLNRRLHAFDQDLLLAIFSLVGTIFSARNHSREYIVDSFPIAVCHNIRIFRCHIFQQEEFRGYCASKKSYSFGVKVHLITTAKGEPVGFSVTPGSCNDMRALRAMSLQLPDGACLYADAAYNDQAYEEYLQKDGITLLPQRRRNMKTQWPGHLQYVQQVTRKRIETSISQIKQLMPSRIAAVTAHGFLLKVYFFILASAITYLS